MSLSGEDCSRCLFHSMNSCIFASFSARSSASWRSWRSRLSASICSIQSPPFIRVIESQSLRDQGPRTAFNASILTSSASSVDSENSDIYICRRCRFRDERRDSTSGQGLGVSECETYRTSEFTQLLVCQAAFRRRHGWREYASVLSPPTLVPVVVLVLVLVILDTLAILCCSGVHGGSRMRMRRSRAGQSVGLWRDLVARTPVHSEVVVMHLV